MLRGKDRNAFPRQWHYCSDMTIDEARMVAKALEDAGPEIADPDGTFRTATSSWNTDSKAPAQGHEGVSISFEPYLPHGETICSPCG